MDVVNTKYEIGDLVSTTSGSNKFGIIIKESFPLYIVLWQYDKHKTWEHYAVLKLIHRNERQ